MTAELVIVTPEILPGSGGVADHTLALLRQWRLGGNVELLVATPAPLSADLPAHVTQLAKSSPAIVDQLPGDRGTVFVQYSAYGYDRLGYPRELIRALIDWKRRVGGRLVVMFHEIWTFWSFTNKNFLVQQLHRRALRRLLEVCDIVFTSTVTQGEHLRGLCSRASVQILPVGSNVRPNDFDNITPEPGCAVLFGLQSSRIRALERMDGSLRELAGSARISRIVCLGQNRDPEAVRRERELLAQLHLPDGFTQYGPLDEAAVSRTLSTAEFGLFGQTAPSCTKSGSFMAYAAHQLGVIAEFANASEPPPICWLISPAELLSGVDRRELERRAECLRMWYEHNSSWNVIASRLGRALAIETEPKTA
jgi:hypothetical protein